MLSNITNFIKSNVAPNVATNPVDIYGNFKVEFKACEGSEGNDNFSDSERITKYSSLPFFDVDLHNFIKNINDVELNVNSKQIELPGVSYGVNRLMPMNSASSITMLWLNTKVPYIESIIVPWMQDNTINNHFPIIKCDLYITFPKLDKSMKKLVYQYYGVRPVECSLHKMTNEPITDFYRKVRFDFDYFFIHHENSSDYLDETTNEDSTLLDTQMSRDAELVLEKERREREQRMADQRMAEQEDD